MTGVELVVARYREDLRWLKRVPHSLRITVYDKSGEASDGLPLPNVGREAHTYLHHIVERYDDLADLTFFVQGKPFDHVPDLHRILRRAAEGIEKVDGFRWYGFVIDEDDRTGARLFQSWSKNPDRELLDMEGFCRALWPGPTPDCFPFYPGAHFAVTADAIRRNPRSFYAKALNLAVDHPNGAHCFERTWDRVFGAHGIPEALRSETFPVFFKPIRRHMNGDNKQ